jgi:predicted dehydrogenase
MRGTPTDMHADLIEQAAKAGKAVFCEKPVDLNAERIEACLKVVKEAGATLMIGFNRRFDPSFADVKRRIDAGEAGNVELVTILSRDPGPPPVSYIKGSGGLFRDMMIHDLDLARFLLGEEPVEVHAVGSNLVDPEIGKAGDVDTAAVLLKTASGRIAQISNSRRADLRLRPADRGARLELVPRRGRDLRSVGARRRRSVAHRRRRPAGARPRRSRVSQQPRPPYRRRVRDLTLSRT